MAKDLAQIFIRATDQTKGAFDSAQRNVRDLGDGVSKLNGLLASVGAGVSVGAFGALIKQSIDAQAALDDLSDSTALTVETLSSLQQTARIGGHSFDTVTATASKFAKSVAEAAGGNKELIRSFEALGISQERLRTAKFDDLYTEFATKIATAENKTYAIAYATDLAGKSAAQALPFFKDLAETGLVQARVSTEQAAAADALQKQMGRLGNEFDTFKNNLASGVVPWLLKFIEELNEATKATGNLFTALNGMANIKEFGATPEEQLKNITAALEKTQKWQRTQLGNGWVSGPLLGLRESSLINLQGIARNNLQRERSRPTAWDGDDAEVGAFGRRRNIPAPRGAAGGSSAADTSGLQLITQLENKLAQARGEGSEFDRVMRQLTDGTKQYTLEVQAAALALAGEIDERERATAAAKASAEAHDRRVAIQEQADKVTQDFNRTQSETLQNLRFETDLLKLTDAEREVAIALRKLENEYLQASVQLVGEETAAYQLRLETLKATYEAQRTALPEAVRGNVEARRVAEANRKAVEDARRMHDDIARSLTDALLRGFENGKGFAENFRDTLKNMFSSLVLRPIIQPIAQGAAGMITGALGFPGTASAAGGGGLGGVGSLFGGGNPMGWIMNAGGIAGSAGAYSAALGLGSSAAGSQAAMLAAQTGEFGLAGLASTASSAGAGAMSGLLSAAPYAAAAVAAFSLLKGRNNKRAATFTGMDMTGTITRAGLQNAAFYGNDANQGYRWSTTDHYSTGYFNEHLKTMFADLERIGTRLGLDTSKLNNASISFSASGLSNTDPQQIAAEMAAQLGAVSDQLARELMPTLDRFAQAGETATQTLTRMTALQEQRTQQLQDAVRSMPGQLGITGLEATRDGLNMSAYASPMQRLATARATLDATYQRGLGGDLGAINSFGGVLQQALATGREVGASGPAFQNLFTEGNRQLNDLLSRQQAVQAELLQNVDVAIVEASRDQVAELKKGFKALVDEVAALRGDLRRNSA